MSTVAPPVDAYVDYTCRFFRKWLPVYDLFAASIFFAYRAAVRRAEPRPGRRILDLCTGTGEIAIACARRGAEVVGVDVTAEMLAKARRKAAGLPVGFALMDARRVDFPDRSFDVTVISFALHDMPRRVRREVLAEAARVTRGRLVILDYDVAPRPRFLARLLTAGVALFESAYFPRFAREGVAPILAEAGLDRVETIRLGPLLAVRRVDL